MLCITLAKLWRSDRDGLQDVFLKPTAQLLVRKTTQQTARARLITDRSELCRASLAATEKYGLNGDCGQHSFKEASYWRSTWTLLLKSRGQF
jgi:hypothetical protein